METVGREQLDRHLNADEAAVFGAASYPFLRGTYHPFMSVVLLASVRTTVTTQHMNTSDLKLSARAD